MAQFYDTKLKIVIPTSELKDLIYDMYTKIKTLPMKRSRIE